MIDHLYKPHILQLEQYKSSRINTDDHICLDWNESYVLNTDLVKYIRTNISNINKYPDPFALPLKEKLSKYLGSYRVSVNNIQLFNGSDSALKTIFDAFCNEHRTVFFNAPDYDQVITFINTNQGKLVDRIYEADIVYLSRPNNPIGLVTPEHVIVDILKQNKLVIIDEAYIEFSKNYSSLVHLIPKYDNLIITRTFSKAFGIAGLRLGYMISNSNIIDYINKIRNIKEVNIISLLAGEFLLDTFDLSSHTQMVDICKYKLYETLSECNLTFQETETNFIPVYTNKPKEFISLFDKHKILFRDKSSHGIVRMTIGNEETTNKIINILKNEYK